MKRSCNLFYIPLYGHSTSHRHITPGSTTAWFILLSSVLVCAHPRSTEIFTLASTHLNYSFSSNLLPVSRLFPTFSGKTECCSYRPRYVVYGASRALIVQESHSLPLVTDYPCFLLLNNSFESCSPCRNPGQHPSLTRWTILSMMVS